MGSSLPSWARRLAVTLAALVAAGVTVSLIVTDDRGPSPGGSHRRTVTVVLGGPGHKAVVLPPAAQAIVKTQAQEDARGDGAAAESNLHEAQAPTVGELQRSEKIKPPGQPQIPETLTQAAPSVPGCTTALVRNYSSRRGAPVLLGVIHWTGSRSLPASTADGLAIVHWFDVPAASASSSEITDDDGHCWLVVPEALKPWTQAAYNSWSVSVEHINPGAGPLFTTAAGRAVVLRLMRGWHRRWKLPYRRAIVTQSGCRVVRSGFLAHRDLGACGGGHPDVGAFDLDGLIRDAAAGDRSARPVSAVDRRTCARMNAWRARGRPVGEAPVNVRRRQALERRGVTCKTQGPVRS